MLNTYIKNRGTTQMLVRNNNKNKFNEINWDADYDGEIANISLDTTSNGMNKHYNIQLDNEDLANLLSVPSVNMPIDKRLKIDLEMPKRELYKIEFPTSSIQEPNTVEDILHTLKQSNGYLSSPMSNEELIVPVSINDKTSHNYSLTPRKQHKKRKTHKTYKVYKKQKSSSNKTKSNQKIKYQRL
jgi:hypothetical protein